METKTKVGKTTVEETVAQKWQNRYESRSRGQLHSVKRFPSPKFEPDHPETPGIKEETKIPFNWGNYGRNNQTY